MALIEVKDLILSKSMKIKDKNTGERIAILKGINAKFEKGKLNVIMGANGCGKTTFLDILYGFYDKDTNTSGTILFDGQPRNINDWFRLVSYSEQKSYEITKETAREVIDFQLI